MLKKTKDEQWLENFLIWKYGSKYQRKNPEWLMIVCASKESNEERRCGDRKLLQFFGCNSSNTNYTFKLSAYMYVPDKNNCSRDILL